MVQKFYYKIGLVLIGLITIIVVYTIIGNFVGEYLNDGGRLVTRYKREALRKGAFLNSDNTARDVLVLGDSEILSGFVPQIFNALSEHKINSINLALPGQPLSSAYYMLKEHLRNTSTKPNAVIIFFNVNYQKINFYGTEGASLEEALGHLYYKNNAEYFVKYLIPSRQYIVNIFKYLKMFLFNRQTLFKLKKKNKDVLDKVLNNDGYLPLSLDRYPNSILPDSIYEPTDNPNIVHEFPNVKEDIYFHKFVELINKHQLKTLVIRTPKRIGSRKKEKIIPSTLESLLLSNRLFFLGNNGWKTKFYKNQFFADTRHLNPNGANKFTKDIFNEFISSGILD